MKYLILAPDYTGSCIQDEFEGEVPLEELLIPKEIADELTIWHIAYREIIPLAEKERDRRLNQIEKLDAQGLKLAKKLEELIPGGAKIKYFSEGKLQYLHFD
jgi:hypothetical protein